VEEVVAVGERGVEVLGQVGFQRAARDLEDVRYVDLRCRCHAPGHAGDERPVRLIGPDNVPAGQVLDLVQGPSYPLQPGMDRAFVGDNVMWLRIRGLVPRVPEQPGVSHVDRDSGTGVPRAHRGIGLHAVVHNLGLRGRARTCVSCDGEDVVGGRIARAEHPVDAVERLEHREVGLVLARRKVQHDDSGDQWLDASMPLLCVRGFLQVPLGPPQDFMYLL